MARHVIHHIDRHSYSIVLNDVPERAPAIDVMLPLKTVSIISLIRSFTVVFALLYYLY